QRGGRSRDAASSFLPPRGRPVRADASRGCGRPSWASRAVGGTLVPSRAGGSSTASTTRTTRFGSVAPRRGDEGEGGWACCGGVASIVIVVPFVVRAQRRVKPSTKLIRRCYMVPGPRSEEHTSELQSREDPVCRLPLETKHCVS